MGRGWSGGESMSGPDDGERGVRPSGWSERPLVRLLHRYAWRYRWSYLAGAFFLQAKVTCDGKLAVRFNFACTMAEIDASDAP